MDYATEPVDNGDPWQPWEIIPSMSASTSNSLSTSPTTPAEGLAASTFNSTSAATAATSSGPVSASFSSNVSPVVIGIVATFASLLFIAIFALAFWYLRRQRLKNVEQAAIRRMTIIGPPHRSSSGRRRLRKGNLFGGLSSNGYVDMERGMHLPAGREREENFANFQPDGSAWARFSTSGDIQLPKPEQAGDHTFSSVAKDVDSLCSKYGFVGEMDRMTLVDGVYILALKSDMNTDPHSVRT